MKTAKKSPLKSVLWAVLAFVLLLVTVAGGYVIYLFADYHRLGDGDIPVGEGASQPISVGESHTALTYNIGFGAYTPDFSFFMDGGTQSRAASKESVEQVTREVCTFLQEQEADLILLEEVDQKATRSHGVDQRRILREAFPEYDNMWCANYDSSYLFYPLDEPHGASLAGMLTLSRWQTSQSRRVELPVEEGFMKFFDLDRCYSVSRLPVSNGRELVVYTAHLSAYTSDGTIATRQLELLLSDMSGEYAKGNYVLCGGDFNKDLLGDSSQYFGVSGEEYTWAQPFPSQLLGNTGFGLYAPSRAPSCRNADAPYHPGQFVLTVDGFIASDNIAVTDIRVAREDFVWSDHNPVSMEFTLLP